MVLRQDELVWTRLNNPLDRKLTDAIRDYASKLENVFENRHFVADGKKLFSDPAGLDFLRAILRHIQKELPLRQKWSAPAIQHAFALYKSAGGPATPLHQDRPYWKTFESEATMMTFWIALEEIDEGMGCLRLNRNDFVEPSQFGRLNTPAEVHPHVQDDSGLRITGEAGARLAEKMSPIPVHEGDIILLDAFQVHASEKNSSSKARRAMKIVMGDAGSMQKHLMTLEDLNAGIAGKTA